MSEFQVFVAYHSPDEKEARFIRGWISDLGEKRVFFDKDDLLPGAHASKVIGDVLKSVSCIVVVCGHGAGPWQTREVETVLIKRMNEVAVIPVLLPGLKQAPEGLDFPLEGLVRAELPSMNPDDPKTKEEITRLLKMIDKCCPEPHYQRNYLEIELPSVSRACVVAAPQSTLESLENLVNEAMSKRDKDLKAFPEATIKLAACGTDGCVRWIRESEMLVADGRSGSLFTAYCVGMARALGKPVILITQAPAVLWDFLGVAPFEKRPRVDVIPDAELSSETLKKHIATICGDLRHPFLIDREVEGITILNWLHVRDAFRPQLDRLLNLGIGTIENCFPVLQEVHSLKKYIDQTLHSARTAHGPSGPSVIVTYLAERKKKYEEFEKAYKDWESKLPDSEKLMNVQNDFSWLKKASKETPPSLTGAECAWGLVVDGIDDCKRYNDTLAGYFGQETQKLGSENQGFVKFYSRQADKFNETVDSVYKSIDRYKADTREMVTHLLKFALVEDSLDHGN